MMAMRSAALRRSSLLSRLRESSRMSSRYFSEGKGRILSEEERAAENVYIQKMEREKLEKMKLKAEKDKAAAENQKKKTEGEHKG